ncbi:MAG: hypothetical protein HY921_12310 [Elusimicrobia bacterium]|nr:hypothetical protein [Elusimicrobiota bacterium]
MEHRSARRTRLIQELEARLRRAAWLEAELAQKERELAKTRTLAELFQGFTSKFGK